MGNEVDQGYRGALDAAYARIAELEQQLVAARAQLTATPAHQARIAQLATQHTSARRAYVAALDRRARVTRRVLLLGAIATLFFTALIASLGPMGHPMNACTLGVVLTLAVSLLVSQLASGEPKRLRREVTMLAQDLEALATQPLGIRVDGRTELLDAASDAEPVAERGRSARRTR